MTVCVSGTPSTRPTPSPRGLAPWLRGYSRGLFSSDAFAGFTLAAYMLPAAIGDASLAGLPPQVGLYACMGAGLVFPWLCGSRQTVVTVTSSISLLMGATLGALARGDEHRHAALAACTALMVAALAGAARLVRAGSLVTFLSESVLVGFKVGVAVTLAATQVPRLLGLSTVHGGVLENARHLVTHAHEARPVAAAIGLGAICLLALGRALFKNKPVALLVVVGGIVAAHTLGLHQLGVTMLGDVPPGPPAIGLPDISRNDLNELLPLALACFLLGAVETAAVGRMLAPGPGQRFDAGRELLALAGANLAAGVAGGYPVSGGLSQSLVNDGAGARTPVSGLLAAGIIALVACFFTGVLRDLPGPVLAAIVLAAGAGLVNGAALVHLWRHDRTELLIAGAALAGVLTSGLLRGVLIGVVISLMLLVGRASRPHVAVLGRIPGTRRYSDMERHPDNLPTPGVCIVRPESAIVYFNADFVRDSVLDRAQSAGTPPHTLVCDLSAVPLMDMAGAGMMKRLQEDLRGLGVRMQVVEARAAVRDRLRAEGIDERAGRVDRFTSVGDAVDAAAGPAEPAAWINRRTASGGDGSPPDVDPATTRSSDPCPN